MMKKTVIRDNTEPPKKYIWMKTDMNDELVGIYEYLNNKWQKIDEFYTKEEINELLSEAIPSDIPKASEVQIVGTATAERDPYGYGIIVHHDNQNPKEGDISVLSSDLDWENESFPGQPWSTYGPWCIKVTVNDANVPSTATTLKIYGRPYYTNILYYEICPSGWGGVMYKIYDTSGTVIWSEDFISTGSFYLPAGNSKFTVGIVYSEVGTGPSIKDYISVKPVIKHTSYMYKDGHWIPNGNDIILSGDVEHDKELENRASTPQSVYDAIYKHKHTTFNGEIEPNTPYALSGDAGNLAITFATPKDRNIVNHYYFTISITSGYSPNITLPNDITWLNGSAPTFTAGKKYEFSVIDNIGVWVETALS